MFRNGIVYSSFLIVIIFSSGCSGYERLLKSDDFDMKYIKAQEYYNEGDYARALPLLEQLLTVKSGTALEEEIRYFIAYAHYGQSEYLISASLFKSFWLSFPVSYRAEECLYMSAFSIYQASPKFELDQTYSEKALESFQFFIDTYDKSDRIANCNDLMDELRKKKEEKVYASANLYFNVENYQAAAITFENLIKEFPETKDAEYINLLIIRSYFNYAAQSTVCKKTERFEKVINTYIKFKERYPSSAHIDEAEGLFKRANLLKEKSIQEQQNYNCNE